MLLLQEKRILFYYCWYKTVSCFYCLIVTLCFVCYGWLYLDFWVQHVTYAAVLFSLVVHFTANARCCVLPKTSLCLQHGMMYSFILLLYFCIFVFFVQFPEFCHYVFSCWFFNFLCSNEWSMFCASYTKQTIDNKKVQHIIIMVSNRLQYFHGSSIRYKIILVAHSQVICICCSHNSSGNIFIAAIIAVVMYFLLQS